MKKHILMQPSFGIRLKTIICCLMFFLLYVNSNAQNVQIENQIRDLDEKERVSMLKEDTAALKKIYDTDIVVNAPFNAVTSGSAVICHLVHTGFIKLSDFSRKIEKVIIKDGVAVTMGSEIITFDKNSTNPSAGQTMKRRYTHVYMKEAGSWKLIARHANEICQR